jgi:glycosyltransferase involved in cell wall biosynthesis
MRIAVWHNLPSGGGKRALYHHLKGLHADGHHIEIWCPDVADSHFLPLSEFGQEHRVPVRFNIPPQGHTAIGHSIWEMRSMEQKVKGFHQHCSQCADEINAGDFDVLFANACTWYRTSYVGGMVRIPSVLYLQEPYRWLYESLPNLPWVALPPPRHRWWSPGYLSWFVQDVFETQALRVQVREELAMARGFSKILVNSLFSRESVMRAYGLDSEVCYLGVDTGLFRPLNLPRENLAVCVGGLYLGKGAEATIRAIGAVSESIRPRLLWIGNFAKPAYLGDMLNLAKTLNVDFQIKVMVADKELVEWYNRASLVIVTPRLEPFGFVPLEAHACETPVVAVAEGGVRETVVDGRNGRLVYSNDPVALGRAITELAKQPELARKLGCQGRLDVIQRWTWGQAVDRLERCLSSARLQ